MSKTICVVAAHPDDEVLGCGGAIAKHANDGDEVHVLFVADGVSSRDTYDAAQSDARVSAAQSACRVLGVTSFYSLGLPDNKIDSLPLIDVIKPIEERLRAIRPEIIYTHYDGDLNIDHELTSRAVATACRPLPGHFVKEIYHFEVMSSTEWSQPGTKMFSPNCYVDISNFLNKKMMALEAYHDEMRDFPHSRSMKHLEALARHRGASVGLEAAEAFFTARILK